MKRIAGNEYGDDRFATTQPFGEGNPSPVNSELEDYGQRSVFANRGRNS